MQGNRRDFIKGCCAAAVAAGSGSAMAFFDPLALSGSKSAATGDVLVYVFLRGAIDGLHLVVPYAGADRVSYETVRGGLAIPVDRLRRIGSTNWGWHPRAGGGKGDGIASTPKWLQKLYNANRLAIVQATGMPVPNRSHFEAQAMMELGTPGITGGDSGWLARYLSTISGTPGLPAPFIAPAFGFGSNMQTSLVGLNEAISFNNAEQFRVDDFHGSWNQRNAHLQILPLWSGNSSLERAGRETADALEYMREFDFSSSGYTPGGGAVYPDISFGRQLRNLAQMLKSPIKTGLIAAAVDHGFWDTHEGQGMPQPGVTNHWDWFGDMTEELGRGLDAFYTDLQAAGLMDKVTVIVQSEFGRRFLPNGSAGTDHGYGNIMMALGNRVNGGTMHGPFPGLDDNSLFESQDVNVTTDFRQVLSEALVDRMGLPVNQLAQVFPGFSYNAGLRNVFQTG